MGIEAKYRAVFRNQLGQEVLDDICHRGRLLDECMTQEHLGRENLAKEILSLALSNDSGMVMREKFIKLLRRIRKKKKK